MLKEFSKTEVPRKKDLLQRKNRQPNLYRVVLEIAKSKKPYESAERLLSIIKSSPEDFTDTNEDIRLTVRDILSIANKS